MDEKKVREAIERIHKMRDAYNATLRSLPQKTRERSDYNNYVDAFLVAIEALEKQLPKKVKMRTEYRDLNDKLICYDGFCPNCGKEVNSYRNKSCSHCTQMLEWTEEVRS